MLRRRRRSSLPMGPLPREVELEVVVADDRRGLLAPLDDGNGRRLEEFLEAEVSTSFDVSRR